MPDGYDLITFDQVDSTMSEAARIASTITKPTWILAETQTAARGTRGREWITPTGNLNATLIYKPNCTAADAARRSFLAANALYTALASYVDDALLSLKWPNDVLLGGGKVAGILLESTGRGEYVDWLSIGIGVNLAHAPDNVENAFSPVSVVGAGGTATSPIDFLKSLAAAFAEQERNLAEFGFERVRADWLKHAARLGDVITAKTGHASVTGTFDTIDVDGNLILITATGPLAIPAAEVFF